MAAPADQEMGGCGESLWMQPSNGLGDPEDDIAFFTDTYMMQLGNGLRNPEDDSDCIPRGDAAREQILANIKCQHLRDNMILDEEGQDEPQYVTDVNAQHVTKRSGPSSEEWTKWKPEIHSVYVDGKCTLEATRAEMAKKGFCAQLVTLPFFHLGIPC
jgi:hypothetical protein